MRRGQYLSLKSFFGGHLLKNANARSPRPFYKKKPTRVTLFSKKLSYQKNFREISFQRKLVVLLRKQGRLHQIKIQGVTSTQEQIQIDLRCEEKESFNNFLRSITGLIARRFLNQERGKANKHKKNLKTNLWIFRPLTCLLEKRTYRFLLEHFIENYFVFSELEVPHSFSSA